MTQCRVYAKTLRLNRAAPRGFEYALLDVGLHSVDLTNPAPSLEEIRSNVNCSFNKGGINAHLITTFYHNSIPHASSVVAVQTRGKGKGLAVEHQGPLFEVVDPDYVEISPIYAAKPTAKPIPFSLKA